MAIIGGLEIVERFCCLVPAAHILIFVIANLPIICSSRHGRARKPPGALKVGQPLSPAHQFALEFRVRGQSLFCLVFGIP